MSLAAIFLAEIRGDRPLPPGDEAHLEAQLAALVAAGRAAWPRVALRAEDFAAFLGRLAPEDLGAVRAGELHLVCAYALGVPAAGEAFEETYAPRVRAALARLGTPPATAADILQELRAGLVELAGPGSGKKGYAGRGDLAAWLCVSAVRAAGRRRERVKREEPFDDVEAARLVAPDDPELAYVCRAYKREIGDAFRAALAELSHRERNVLRQHFVEGLSIDQIGGIYGVHRATAARWINRAREDLCARTRELVARRVSLSAAGFERMLGLIASQISVRLEEAQAS